MFLGRALTVFVVHPFFFNDTATTEIYTLSLHDALPILGFFSGSPIVARSDCCSTGSSFSISVNQLTNGTIGTPAARSEEHTSELQSRLHLVCRLLLEKKTTAQQQAHGYIADELPLHSPF